MYAPIYIYIYICVCINKKNIYNYIQIRIIHVRILTRRSLYMYYILCVNSASWSNEKIKTMYAKTNETIISLSLYIYIYICIYM